MAVGLVGSVVVELLAVVLVVAVLSRVEVAGPSLGKDRDRTIADSIVRASLVLVDGAVTMVVIESSIVVSSTGCMNCSSKEVLLRLAGLYC